MNRQDDRAHTDHEDTNAAGQARELRRGTVAALLAYLLWGLLPIYWKQLDLVPAPEILVHRVIWSAVAMFVVALIWYRGQLRAALSTPRRLLVVPIAALLISANWLTYNFAVVADRIVEASLGYYINPLVSVLLGVVVLHERLTKLQILAVAIASAGVALLTIRLGIFPWISLALAFSFGSYGLVKKLGGFSAIVGLTLELLLLAPFAGVTVTLMHRRGAFGAIGAFGSAAAGGAGVTILLVLAGIVTATPLLLFGAGAKRVPLSRVGFLQYVAPTLMLLIGTIIYGEPFTPVHAVSFVLIWSALGVYSVSLVRSRRHPRDTDRETARRS